MTTAVDTTAPRDFHDVLRRVPVRELGMIPAIIIACFIGTMLSSHFLTRTNLTNVLQQSSELAILVFAQALIVIVGRFDLSHESIVGFAPMVAAWLVVPAAAGGQGAELPGAVGLVVMFAIGALIGAMNAVLVVKLGLNAFIATLAVLILFRGATLGVADGRTLANLPVEFTYLGSMSMLGVPLSVWIAALLFALTSAFMRYHRLGRALYVIGGNAEAGRSAGLRVDRITMSVFVFGGLLAALAGLLYTGRLGAVTANQGQNVIFNVMAAAVIGGISLNGGRGTIFGALTGVLLLGVIGNILTLSQVSTFWIQASQGAIILGALLFQRFTTGETER